MAGIFPSEASIIRLIGAALLVAGDEWQLQHRDTGVEPSLGSLGVSHGMRAPRPPPAYPRPRGPATGPGRNTEAVEHATLV